MWRQIGRHHNIFFHLLVPKGDKGESEKVGGSRNNDTNFSPLRARRGRRKKELPSACQRFLGNVDISGLCAHIGGEEEVQHPWCKGGEGGGKATEKPAPKSIPNSNVAGKKREKERFRVVRFSRTIERGKKRNQVPYGRSLTRTLLNEMRRGGEKEGEKAGALSVPSGEEGGKRIHFRHPYPRHTSEAGEGGGEEEHSVSECSSLLFAVPGENGFDCPLFLASMTSGRSPEQPHPQRGLREGRTGRGGPFSSSSSKNSPVHEGRGGGLTGSRDPLDRFALFRGGAEGKRGKIRGFNGGFIFGSSGGPGRKEKREQRLEVFVAVVCGGEIR